MMARPSVSWEGDGAGLSSLLLTVQKWRFRDDLSHHESRMTK